MKKFIAIILMFALTFALASCGGSSTSSENISENIEAEKTETGEVNMSDADKACDFAVRLLKANAKEGINTLISPFSVMTALAMTANGAVGETRAQMEDVLGMTVEELNKYLSSYIASLPEGEKYKLKPANSIWFTSDERFTVNEDFLKSNKSVYDADIYRTPFDDSTLKDINNWVSDKTDGMIPEILDKIPEEAVMYLVNALAFDAEWWDTYTEDQVWDSEFTREDGTKEKIRLMYSEEWRYMESDKATGFLRSYKDDKYAFAALLPNEGVTVDELVGSLNGAKLHEMLSSPEECTVNAAIPIFETEFSTEMSQALKGMGMPLAFDLAKADFSGLGHSDDGNIAIGRVIHKTFISVAEKGTKAGAATVVEMLDEGAAFVEDPKNVILDRPFLYMIIDTETSTPLFIGTLMSITE